MPILNMVGGGSKGGNIGEPLNLTVTAAGTDATITWEDNEIGTIPPTSFAKSELVRKVGSAPTSPSDGTLVVTETVKDTYKVSGYTDSGLTDGTTYYYRVFSYSDLGGISYCDAVSITASAGWTPASTALAYYTFDDQGADGYVKDILNGYNLTSGTQPSYTQVLGTNYAGNYYNASSGAASYGTVHGWTSYLNSSFSLALWFKASSNSGQQYLAMLNDGAEQIAIIYNYNSNQVETYGDTRATILSNTQTDTWYCLGISRGNGTLKTYLNGTLVNSVSTTHNQGNSNFSLGGINAAGGRFHGLIGECVIDSVLWSDTNFSDYFNQTKGDYGIS